MGTLGAKKTATLVLGGGAALGLAHIGVLSVLEKHFEITGIIGASMGAIVGALYSIGRSPTEILKIASRQRNAKVFSPLNLDLHIRGIFDGRYMLKLFEDWTDNEWIENGNIPFIACAYDLLNRSTVLFDQGAYADAMRASSSLPLIFAPYAFNKYLLVDGGTQTPLPLAFTHLFKSDLVVAVNVLPLVESAARRVDMEPADIKKRKRIHRTEVVMQAVFQNQAYLALRDIIAYEPDIVIDAAMPENNPFAFHKANSFFEYGKNIAKITMAEYHEPNFIDKTRRHYLNMVAKMASLALPAKDIS